MTKITLASMVIPVNNEAKHTKGWNKESTIHILFWLLFFGFKSNLLQLIPTYVADWSVFSQKVSILFRHNRLRLLCHIQVCHFVALQSFVKTGHNSYQLKASFMPSLPASTAEAPIFALHCLSSVYWAETKQWKWPNMDVEDLWSIAPFIE